MEDDYSIPLTDQRLKELEERVENGGRYISEQPNGWKADNWKMRPWQDLFFRLQATLIQEKVRRGDESDRKEAQTV